MEKSAAPHLLIPFSIVYRGVLSKKFLKMKHFVTVSEAKLHLRITFSVRLNCDSKRKYDRLLRLWGFLEVRNAGQETLDMCTNSCSTSSLSVYQVLQGP